MPIFRLQMFKRRGAGKPWSNVYHVLAGSMAGVQGDLGAFIAAERAIHNAAVTITYARISDLVPGTDTYVTMPINQAGLTLTQGGLLPLENTVRVDMTAAGGGRPSRKYYRLPLTESEQEDSLLSGPVQATVLNALQGLLADLAGTGVTWVDPDGQVLTGVAVWPYVQTGR